MSMELDFGQNYTEIITRLNHERMLFQLPVMVVLSLIMAVSMVGNTLVVSVYKTKYKKRTSNYFIMVLGIVDLGSTLCIPFVVFDLANPLMHPTPVLCKINRFMEALSSTASGLVLVCIAFDRYFHVCYPLRIYSLRQAHSLTVVMLTLAVSLSWPMLFLAGKKTVETSVPGVSGEDCSYRDGVYNSIYTLLFQGGLIFTFFVSFVIFTVFYARIFYVIYKRRHTIIGEQFSKKNNETSFGTRKLKSNCRRHNHPITAISIIDNTHNEHIQTEQSSHHIPNGLDNTNLDFANDGDQTNSKPFTVLKPKMKTVCFDNTTCGDASSPDKSENTKKRVGQGTMQIRTTRTTIILAMVTLAAIIGYMPYLIVSLMMNSGKYFQPGMSVGEDLVYEFCAKSYFLNGAANPIINSVMNPAFRRDSATTLKRFINIFHRK